MMAILEKMALENYHDAGRMLESPSTERNNGQIYSVLLGLIVFPRLVNNAACLHGSPSPGDNRKIVVRGLELVAWCGVHTTNFVKLFLTSGKDGGGSAGGVYFIVAYQFLGCGERKKGLT